MVGREGTAVAPGKGVLEWSGGVVWGKFCVFCILFGVNQFSQLPIVYYVLMKRKKRGVLLISEGSALFYDSS